MADTKKKGFGPSNADAGLDPHVPTTLDAPRDIGGGYKELTQSYIEKLVAAAANPATPCQLIDAASYKQLAKILIAVEGQDRKQLLIWALGHGDTGIKKYIKSKKAKETLAGLKLIELLMVQVGKDFASEVTCQKWTDRLYGVFSETGEPILKMTIAQHIADWTEMFKDKLDVTHLKTLAAKITKNAAINGGYGVPKPTQMSIKYAGGRPGGLEPPPKLRASASPASKKPPAEEVEEPDTEPVREVEQEVEVPKPEKKVLSKESASRADIMAQCFQRYDIDKSGSINDAEELSQLCTNLCFKLKIMLPPGTVEKKIEELGDLENMNMNLGEFAVWFDEAFDQKAVMK